MTKTICRKLLKKPFENPYSDASDPALWDEEIEIIERMLAGETLVQDRHYFESGYGVHWYWESHPNYPPPCENSNVSDGPVERLMSRGVIRSVRVAGGYTKMVFTDNAEKVLK